MEPTNRNEPRFHQQELTTLVDLQRFLLDEIAQGETPSDLSRAFMPLTDGLGIQSTGTPQAAGASRAPTIPSLEEAVTEYRAVRAPAAQPMAQTPTTRIAEALFESVPEEETATEATESLPIEPPPVPVPPLFRRFLAGFVDQAFVLMAWALAMAITSNALSTGPAGLLKSLTNPVFLQSAILEFAIIWG
ncbi:hypothetical protein K2X33_10960, partial [bacterium]|nr:hypothetical protein [bacterium]